MNRAGCSTVKNQTPYEIWLNKNFMLQMFKEFGSKVAVHVIKNKRKKLDSKSENGILVGYGETTKGYRIYFPHTGNIEIHRDVIFIPENEKPSETQIDNKDCEEQQKENKKLPIVYTLIQKMKI